VLPPACIQQRTQPHIHKSNAAAQQQDCRVLSFTCQALPRRARLERQPGPTTRPRTASSTTPCNSSLHPHLHHAAAASPSRHTRRQRRRRLSTTAHAPTPAPLAGTTMPPLAPALPLPTPPPVMPSRRAQCVRAAVLSATRPHRQPDTSACCPHPPLLRAPHATRRPTSSPLAPCRCL
jgi:hypothetical protein